MEADGKIENIFPGVWKVVAGIPDVSLTGCAGCKPSDALKKAVSTGNIPEVSCQRRGDYFVLRLALTDDETVFGGGLLFRHTVLKNEVFHIRMDHSKGVDNGRTHAPVPFFVTSGGIGIFCDTPHEVIVHAGCSKRKEDKVLCTECDRTSDPAWRCFSSPYFLEAAVRAKGVNIILFKGKDVKDCVARFNLYCGGGFIPPKWGLGLWHRTNMSMDSSQILALTKEYEKHGFPLSVIGLEPGWQSASYPSSYEWSDERFDQPEKFIAELNKKDIKVNLWENPCISEKSSLYDKLLPYAGSHLVWNGIIPDLSLPEVRRIMKKHHQENHFNYGVSGYKLDESDGFDQWLWPDFAEFPSGLDGFAYRSVCGILFQRFTNEIYKEHGLRTYGLTRSSNGGAVSLPYVLYNDNYDFREFLTALCSCGFSGCLWTPEIRNAATSSEWLRRFQLGCVSPLLLLNAWANNAMPWMFDEVSGAVLEAVKLRRKLLPYLYSAFARYHFEGIPPYRSLFMDYGMFLRQSDKAGVLDDTLNPYQLSESADITDQFIFGDTLMAAPLFPDCDKRKVIFPPGKWFDFYSGELISDGGIVEICRDADSPLPLFAPDGAVIPLDENGELKVKTFGSKCGEFKLYCDDGFSSAGEAGDHHWQTFTADGVR